MDLVLRPRSATEIVDAAVRLFRRHFVAFVALAALAAVPRIAIATAAQLWVASRVGDLTQAGAGAALFSMFAGPYLLISLASLVVQALFEGASVSLADDALRTGDATAGRALARGMARAGAVLATFFAVSLIVLVGFMFLIVPGVYLALRLYSAIPAAVIEGVGPGEALSRAWRRTRGAAGRGFVVYLLLFLIFLLVFIAATMIGGTVGAAIGAIAGSEGALVGAVGSTMVVSVLLDLLFYPLLSAATTVFYYDTRVRSEALDVELMADALAGPGAPVGARV